MTDFKVNNNEGDQLNFFVLYSTSACHLCEDALVILNDLHEQMLELAKEQDKLLFIDFETTWCGPCRTMDLYVYTADVTVEAFNNILAVKIDGDENRELVKKYDVKAYPTMLILSPKGKIIAKKVGYLSVKDIVAFINEAKNNL